MIGARAFLRGAVLSTIVCLGAPVCGEASPTTIFQPISTSGREVQQLAQFVLWITGGIFFGVSALLVYALIRYRQRGDDPTEPPQVFGSTQIELSWTIIPILGIVMLFLGTARVIFAVQDAPEPKNALEVVAIGHQFWWEFRYPQYNVTTANELHVPQSVGQNPRPTFLKLTSADVAHSLWIPRLSGKIDLWPNRVNGMWFDPQIAGLYLGQCAQFCGPEHAKMLVRVYVDPPAVFEAWVRAQQQPQGSGTARPRLMDVSSPNPGSGSPPNTPPTVGETAFDQQRVPQAINAAAGRIVFEQQACINCHNVTGTVANGRFGPDLTHLMSRETIAAGIAKNTPENLLRWINDPNDFKPGSLMPAMHLTDLQNQQITAYLVTLR